MSALIFFELNHSKIISDLVTSGAINYFILKKEPKCFGNKNYRSIKLRKFTSSSKFLSDMSYAIIHDATMLVK